MIIAIVLAAGMSTRFGFNKLLYRFNDNVLIRNTVENIVNSSVDKVIVITGYMKDFIEEVLIDLGVETIYNRNYTIGMSSSIVTGVEYIIDKYSNVEAVFFTPGDCAWIKSITYDQLIDFFYEKTIVKPVIIIASYCGYRGHPVLFSSDLLNDLKNVSEETRGLKHVIDKYRSFVRLVELNDPGVVLDIDSYIDINRVKYYAKK